jgi:signal transduction histidine kinase
VQAHGGTMTATSEVGHGSTVRLTLPLPIAPE